MTTTDYQKQATDFLDAHGLTFSATFKGKNCPQWGGDNARTSKLSCPKCGGVHGWEYEITISRGRTSLSFPYWNSWVDTHFQPKTTGDPHGDRPITTHDDVRDSGGRNLNQPSRRMPPEWIVSPPTAYDALACISSDANCPADFAEFCADFGYDTDSRKAEAMHKRYTTFALKLRQFFTDAELSELAEIQ